MKSGTRLQRSTTQPERRLVLIAALAIVLGLIGRWLLPHPPVWKTTIELLSPEGNRLAAVVYRMPGIGPPASMPGAVLCHGISCSKELMETIGMDLVRHGFLVLAFDFPGHGESDRHALTEEANTLAVQAAVARVRRYPEVNPHRVVVVGHSMGAVCAAMAAGRDRKIAAVVCLGQKGPYSGDLPRNHLQGYGVYDQYHAVPSMMRALSDCVTTPTVLPVGSIAGISSERFVTPGNRVLLLTPDGDHSSEVYSVGLIPQVRNWLLQAVGRSPSKRPAPSAWRVYFDFLFGMGLYVIGTFVVSRRASIVPRRMCSLLPLLAVGLGGILPLPSGVSERASLSITLFYLMVTTGLYCGLQRDQASGQAVTAWFSGLALLAASFAAGSILGTVDRLCADPYRTIPWLPVAWVNIIVHRCHFVFNILRADFFSGYTNGWRPSVLFLILLLLEPILPGFPCRGIGWLGTRIRSGVEGFRLSMSLGTGDRKALGLLGLLMLLLVLVGLLRFREGMLGANALVPASVVMLRMYGISVIVLCVLLRVLPILRRKRSPRSG